MVRNFGGTIGVFDFRRRGDFAGLSKRREFGNPALNEQAYLDGNEYQNLLVALCPLYR